MATTSSITLTADLAWVELADSANDATALLQLTTDGPVIVHHGGSSAPASDAAGITLRRNGLEEIIVSDMDGSKLWARAVMAEVERVTIMKTAAA